MGEGKGYEEFLKYNPGLKEVIPESFWDYSIETGDFTGDTLGSQWISNLKKNIRHLYPKHRSVPELFGGVAKNKAVIGVGAGPSFNLNKKDLYFIYQQNVRFLVADQPFIIIATNHQYKPLLNMGIYPHFVTIIEGGDHVYDQLCTDVPELGKTSILLSSLDTNHDILKEWDRQGKTIAFFLPGGGENKKNFKKRAHENPDPITLGTGGNVMNAVFSIAFQFLGARVFMAVGNDLSFKASADTDERRKSFYADEDYKSNIESNRDEAKDRLSWMGIKFVDSKVAPHGSMIDLEPVMTSRQFLVYKTWLEMHVGAWGMQGVPFRYYNCSEGGISGVVNTERNTQAFKDINTWRLMDEVVPGRWFTMRLIDAANGWMEFLRRCRTLWETEEGAGRLVVSPWQERTGGAKTIVQPGSGIILPH